MATCARSDPGPGAPEGLEIRISLPRRVVASVTVFSLNGVSASTVTSKPSPAPTNSSDSGRRPSTLARPVAEARPAGSATLRSEIRTNGTFGVPLRRHVEQVDRRIAEQLRDPDRRGPEVDVLGRADLRDLPLREHRDCVAERHRLLVVLGDVDRGRTLSGEQPRQLDPHLEAQLRVDVAQRVVEQEHLRRCDERAGERGALLLAVRQRSRIVGEDMRDLEQSRDVLDPARMSTSLRLAAVNGLAMLSKAVMWGKSAKFWNAMPTPRSSGGTPVMSAPSSAMVPASCSTAPAMQRRSTVLPAPEGPKSASVPPSGTSNETPSRRYRPGSVW